MSSAIPSDKPLVAIAMLGHIPTDADVNALQNLGLSIVQPLHHLPMALVKGPWPQLMQAYRDGIARDIYLDHPLKWDSEESTAAMNADQTRAAGYIGTGVGIAIVDSGIDATHPVLKNRVVHNVRVYSPEYGGVTGVGDFGVTFPDQPSLVISFDALPYDNTDTIGHGTHVSSLAAGDATGDPRLVGVAPGASLIGYSTGEILFIITALAAYDDILANHDKYNIKVINNSWGSGYALFNPDDPINVATKAAHDAGITVVFSAGNEATEMATGPNEMAPWVIGVGSTTVSKQRSDFSSGGLMFDNTQSVSIPGDGHLHFDGDGLGITHPDVSAPGSNILGAGTPTGVTATPGTPPGGTASLSGTSMAAPHISGLAAVLLQANPGLTPDQVIQVLKLAAQPMRDDAPFWASGYGMIDAKAAVDLVKRGDFSQALLDQMQKDADAKELGARDFSVLSSDHWMFTELIASVQGVQSKTVTIDVGPDTDAIRASITFSADLGAGVDEDLLFEWSLELFDPDGKSVGVSTRLPNHPVDLLQVEFVGDKAVPRKPGKWTVKASGDIHVSEPSLLWGNLITMAVTQLKQQQSNKPAGPTFVKTGELAFKFTGGGGSLPSPEGCSYDLTGVVASMTTGEADKSGCHSGTVGFLINYGLSSPAEFISDPLPADTVIGGPASLRVYLSDFLQPVWSLAFASGLNYAIDALDKDGKVIAAVAGGDMGNNAAVGPTPVKGDYPFVVPATAVPAGARLRLHMSFSGVYDSTMRQMWDGSFADSGMTLSVGKLEQPAVNVPSAGVPDASPAASTARFGGVLGLGAVLPLLLLAGLGRRRGG